MLVNVLSIVPELLKLQPIILLFTKLCRHIKLRLTHSYYAEQKVGQPAYSSYVHAYIRTY